ncbi:MAG: MarR family transcriptional regulator [Cyclobacteriaceae bacterium]
MARIEEEIKQTSFRNEYVRAVINLLYTSNKLQQSHAAILKPYGITTPQFNILRILKGQHPNPSTVNLLIERMLDKSSNASRIVDKLESKGLVERRQCKSDRRAVDVYISQEGLDLLEKIDLDVDHFQNEVRNLNEEESRQLNQLLDKIRG